MCSSGCWPRRCGSGGDFAEVFAEDKRSTSAGLDDGRVEQLSSGRDRGAGIRVVVGDTTGFAHTADLSERGLTAAAEAPPPRPAPAAGRPPSWRSPGVGRARGEPRRAATRRRAQGHQGRAARRAWTTRPRDRRVGRPGVGQLRRQPQAVLVANSDGVLTDDTVVRVLVRVNVVADGDTGMQTGFQSIGHTVGLEMFDRSTSRSWPATPPARPSPSSTPARRRRARMPVVIGRAAAACSSTRRAATASRPTSSPRAPASSPARWASRWRRRSSRSSTTAPGRRVGHARHRRRGPPHPAQRAHRGRRAHRLHVGLPAGPQGGPPAPGNGRRQSYSTCRWCG